MSIARISALAKRILMQFLRDKRTLILLFFVPAAVMSLLGYVFGTEIEEIEIGLVNDDRGISRPGVSVSIVDVFIPILEKDRTFEVSEMSSAEADKLMSKGEIKAIVRFDRGFTENLVGGNTSVMDVVLEGSDPQLNSAIARGLQQDLTKLRDNLKALGKQFNLSILGKAGTPITIETSYYFGGSNFEIIDYFAPVYIAFFVFFFVFMLTSVSFLRERSRGTMERLLASPISKFEIVIGYLAGFILFAIAQSLIILLFAVYALKINYVGNLLLVLLVEIILTVCAVNLGIFLSTFARNELQVVQFIPLVIVPQVIVSGIVWPVESMPKLMQIFAYTMPLTYANFALRDVMIKGFGALDIWPELAILSLFAVSMMILGALTLRREVT